MTDAGDLVIPIKAEVDVVTARQRARVLVSGLRFSISELTLIATAISEVARNIVTYAGRGEIVLRIVQRGPRWRTDIRRRAAWDSACLAPSD
jgi:serine/threonine-protein kinase RsbT